MRKRKTPAANDPSIKNIQLLIDAELLEMAYGWENVIISFAQYLKKTNMKGDLTETFSGFRAMFTFWLKSTMQIKSEICKEWVEHLKDYLELTKPIMREINDVIK